METLVNLRTEKCNDGRAAVLADITGGSRVFFGYIADKPKHLSIGGADRIVFPLVQ